MNRLKQLFHLGCSSEHFWGSWGSELQLRHNFEATNGASAPEELFSPLAASIGKLDSR